MSGNDQVTYINEPMLLSNYSASISHNNVASAIDSFGNLTVNISNDSSFISNLSSPNGSLKRDFVFDRTDVRVIFITLYSLVFCCCFFGKFKSYKYSQLMNFFMQLVSGADVLPEVEHHHCCFPFLRMNFNPKYLHCAIR